MAFSYEDPARMISTEQPSGAQILYGANANQSTASTETTEQYNERVLRENLTAANLERVALKEQQTALQAQFDKINSPEEKTAQAYKLMGVSPTMDEYSRAVAKAKSTGQVDISETLKRTQSVFGTIDNKTWIMLGVGALALGMVLTRR